MSTLARYALYIDGAYKFPVSHSHACDLIGVEIPLSDPVGTAYEREMPVGVVVLKRMPDLKAPAWARHEDRDCGYDCEGAPIGG